MNAGNVDTVKALVAAHADVTIPAEHGVTALHAAAELGNMELVQLLLQVWSKQQLNFKSYCARVGCAPFETLSSANDILNGSLSMLKVLPGDMWSEV